MFFGLVAVSGSAFVQTERVTSLALLAGVSVGLLATALLVTNNLRDIPGDTVAKKRTLAVRLGDGRTRTLYLATLLGALGCCPLIAFAADRWWALIALGSAVVAAPAVRTVRAGATGRALIPVLGRTSQTQLVFGLLLCLGLVLPS